MTEADERSVVDPDDENVRQKYFWRLRGDYPEHTASVADEELFRVVREGLALCGPLSIDEPNEIVLFLALAFLITPEQRKSPLLRSVYQQVIGNTDFSARRRLAFVVRHLVGRAVPSLEPDFGPWFVSMPVEPNRA